MLEATKKSLLQAKNEKENLIYRIKKLGNNSQIYHSTCNEDKEKYKIKKRKEITNLKEILRTKDIESTNTNAKVEALKLNNKKVDAKILMTNVGEDNFLDGGFESFVKNLDVQNKSFKTSLSQKIVNGGVESNMEQRY